jgi:hypothetical protein
MLKAISRNRLLGFWFAAIAVIVAFVTSLRPNAFCADGRAGRAKTRNRVMMLAPLERAFREQSRLSSSTSQLLGSRRGGSYD